MDDRIKEEFFILQETYPDSVLKDRWVLVRHHALPDGWGHTAIPVAFHVRDTYLATGPYGIYVPSGLRFKDEKPTSFTDPAPTVPPFEGKWAIFSWVSEGWKSASNSRHGHNFTTWVYGFATRFKQGV